MGAKWSNSSPTTETMGSSNGAIENHVTLSHKQKSIIKDSWKVVSENMKEFGILLFLRLFLRHPDYKNVFPAFRGEDVEDLGGSLVLRAHSTIVMQTLMSSLDHLDDPERVKRQLYRIVGLHYDMGIRLAQYKEMLDLLLEMLAEKNLNFEQPHYEAWNIAIGILLTSIGEIMEGIEMEYIT